MVAVFCPNCGKDCGDANFCSYCGEKIRSCEESFDQKKERLITAGEVFCPDCLSTSFVEVQDNPFWTSNRSPVVQIMRCVLYWINRWLRKKYGIECECLKCNRHWYPKMERLYAKYENIITGFKMKHEWGWYAYERGPIEQFGISTREFVFDYRNGDRYIMLFDDIVAFNYVTYPSDGCSAISFRDRRHRLYPFPKKLTSATKDRLTIVFRCGRNDNAFEDMHDDVLKLILECNREFGLIT